ncbi:MAG TPA: DMT family transporter [Nitrososphaerales archaeon]|nr:DMT family transporter [Nitrososphaerales archaeon]
MIEAGFYGLSAALLWGFADFVSRKPTQQIGYYLTCSYMQVCSFFPLLIMNFMIGPVGINAFSLRPNLIVINLFVGVLSFLGFVSLYKGYAKGTMSIVAPIAASYPIVSILLAFVIIGEALTFLQGIAISVVLVGVLLTGSKFSGFLGSIRKYSGFNETDGRSWSRDGIVTQKVYGTTNGMWLAVAASLTFGAAYFGLSQLSVTLGFLLPLVVMRGGAAITGFTLILPLRQRFLVPTGSTLFWLLVMALLDTFGFFALNLGFLSSGNSLPVVVTLSSLLGVVTTIFARIFYKERLNVVQVVGILLVLTGVAVSLNL